MARRLTGPARRRRLIPGGSLIRHDIPAGPGGHRPVAASAGDAATLEAAKAARRVPVTHTFLMCPPEFFAVEYAINAWMDPRDPPDRACAWAQWRQLRATLTGLGHAVHTIDPVPGLPDMVFAADGATLIGGKVLSARFRWPQRAPESAAYLHWLTRNGYGPAAEARAVTEGGDVVDAGRVILAGYGFRTDQAAAGDLEALFGLPVLSLRLVNERFYHLDTALCVLDDDCAAYYPAAFDEPSRATLAGHFPVLVEAEDQDAEVLGETHADDADGALRRLIVEDLSDALDANARVLRFKSYLVTGAIGLLLLSVLLILPHNL